MTPQSHVKAIYILSTRTPAPECQGQPDAGVRPGLCRDQYPMADTGDVRAVAEMQTGRS